MFSPQLHILFNLKSHLRTTWYTKFCRKEPIILDGSLYIMAVVHLVPAAITIMLLTFTETLWQLGLLTFARAEKETVTSIFQQTLTRPLLVGEEFNSLRATKYAFLITLEPAISLLNAMLPMWQEPSFILVSSLRFKSFRTQEGLRWLQQQTFLLSSG